MMLYIVRHGDPDYEHNTITPHGHKEAAALAQWFRDIPLDEIPESIKTPIQTWVSAVTEGGSDKDYGIDAAVDMVKYMIAAYDSAAKDGKRVDI